MAKIKKAQGGVKKPMSAKDSMNMYANRYDSLSAEAAKKLGSKKDASKDIKGANEARAKESAIAKRLYGTTPSNKKGGVTKKKMQAGGVSGKQPKAGMVDPKGAYTKVQQRTLGSMKKGGKMSKKK